MKRAQLSMTYPEDLVHPIHRRIRSGTAITRAELLLWSPTAEATTLLWCDGGSEAAREVLDGLDSLVTSTVIEDVEGTYVFVKQDEYEFGAAILDVVADTAVIFRPPVVFLETGAVRFEAVGAATALDTLSDRLSELGELTVERVQEFERTDAPGRLTDRQRAALETAVAVGYYEIPREGTVEAVAAELGCATSTAGELIRKAERAVLRWYTKAGTDPGAGPAHGPR